MNLTNPFNITKAVDFSDHEINAYWVDIQSGFRKLAPPTSPMPTLILGGKGSGKTHLMRYYSYQLQKIRNDTAIDGIKADGYVGVYLRCGGLNSSRFSGKGQTDEVWHTVFAYYVDLWLAQLVLATIDDLFAKHTGYLQRQQHITNEIKQLFDVPDFPHPKSVQNFLGVLRELQREVDSAVNNCAITKTLDVKIRFTNGQLVFGVPKVLVNQLEDLNPVLIVYLVDELENLSESQQKYINTLLREREGPCTFKIGARTYGMKTYQTFSGEEENKEGSEYDLVPLDTHLRSIEKEYKAFALRVLRRRLTEGGYLSRHDTVPETELTSFFEELDLNRELSNIASKYQERERPYFRDLTQKLLEGVKARCAPGVHSADDVKNVVNLLRAPENLFAEKLNVYLFYKAWYQKKDLQEEGRRIAEGCREYMAQPNWTGLYKEAEHFKADLLAQLFRDCGLKLIQQYVGLETFVSMSEGLPRSFLIILKSIFKWSLFNGEAPFRNGPISIKSQEAGIREAAEWFYRDARMTGVDGTIVRDSIARLATFFKEVRFSDKPAECSVCAFSTDTTQVSAEAMRVIDLAEKWSLLINIAGGQKHKNSLRVDAKYQLNGMLAPRWDLPINRRGTLELSADEVNSIFDPGLSDQFNELMRGRVDRMTAPFFGRREAKERFQKAQDQHEIQLKLEGLE